MPSEDQILLSALGHGVRTIDKFVLKKFVLKVIALNWQKVRGFGELQILTRASYLMLILVPMLAALWPAVHYSVSRYNHAVVDTRDALENAAVKLEHQIDRAEALISSMSPSTQDADESKTGFVTRANGILESVRQRADQVVLRYSPKTVKTPHLPGALAEVFFAAFAVLLGHLFYQMFAPDTVRRQSAREFVNATKNDYAANPTEAAIRRAIHYLNTNPAPEYMQIVKLWEETSGDMTEHERQKQSIAIVEYGASEEYRQLSIQAPLTIVISTHYCPVIS